VKRWRWLNRKVNEAQQLVRERSMPNSQQQQPVAIVTASGSGIGAACARALAKEGFHVSLMSPSDSNLRLADELGGIGRLGSVIDNRDLDALVDATLSTYGRIDAVVNNMGHGSTAFPAMETLGYDPNFDASPLDLPDSVWRESFEMYVMSVINMARRVTPIMVKQGSGAIVNISSPNALEPRQPYPMSVLRSALHGFTKLYADRYARNNVRMNNLLPGFCENVNFTGRSLEDIPMARPARFDEIASACVFLATDASSYMTGQNLLVDGGANRAVR
jgi:NAD(P)-dependent dehydrogenase (short-subunit alcohol dehydrogenase family)